MYTKSSNAYLLDEYALHKKLKCYYCNRKLVRSHGAGDTNPDHATIEHLYPRQDIRRHLVGESIRFKKPCCHRCNQKKNIEVSEQIKNWYRTNIDQNKKIDLVTLAKQHLRVRYSPKEDAVLRAYLSKTGELTRAAAFCAKKLQRSLPSVLQRWYKIKHC